MKYRFERDPEGGIIPVNVQLNGKHTFKMVLDTGASHTTIEIIHSKEK
jgi:predicted aspartyl protease